MKYRTRLSWNGFPCPMYLRVRLYVNPASGFLRLLPGSSGHSFTKIYKEQPLVQWLGESSDAARYPRAGWTHSRANAKRQTSAWARSPQTYTRACSPAKYKWTFKLTVCTENITLFFLQWCAVDQVKGKAVTNLTKLNAVYTGLWMDTKSDSLVFRMYVFR